MSKLIVASKIPVRQPVVEFRREELSEERAAVQIQRGMFVVERGVRYAIPADRVKEPTTFLNRDLWRQDSQGRVFRPGVRWQPTRFQFQRKALTFLRDNVNRNIPYWWYLATLGHDIHTSSFGELYGKHWHKGWANPFEPDRFDSPIDPTFQTMHDTHFVDHECDLEVCPAALMSWSQYLEMAQGSRGFIEDLGLLSLNKVTTAFISETIDELVSTTGTEFADFDFHEVGTSSAVEANTQTALTTTSGIARATGTPTDSDPVYQTVATITADATESWEEEGVFNNTTGAAMMDRNLTGGQSVNSSDQVQYTYLHTQNPEA